MKWNKVEEQLPFRLHRPYWVLVVRTKKYDTGIYKGQGERMVVLDWVVRAHPEIFTYWTGITSPD